MRNTKTTQLLFLYIIYALIAMGAYIGFYFFISAKEANTNKLNAEVAHIQNENDQFTSLNSVVRNIQEDQEKLNDLFIESDALVDFLVAIEKIGGDANVEVDSIREAETSIDEITELQLNISVIGTWQDVYSFLVLIENFPKRIILDSAQFGIRASEDDGGEVWRGFFIIKALQLNKE